MPNRLTKGKALLGDVKVASGQLVHLATATVARTDTAAKTLFTLPASATITCLRISGAAVSNAATTATLAIGKVGGTGSDYLSGFDVKGATGAGQQHPTGAELGSVGSAAVQVTGTYAETGTASTSGGPWTIIAEYTTA